MLLLPQRQLRLLLHHRHPARGAWMARMGNALTNSTMLASQRSKASALPEQCPAPRRQHLGTSSIATVCLSAIKAALSGQIWPATTIPAHKALLTPSFRRAPRLPAAAALALPTTPQVRVGGAIAKTLLTVPGRSAKHHEHEHKPQEGANCQLAKY